MIDLATYLGSLYRFGTHRVVWFVCSILNSDVFSCGDTKKMHRSDGTRTRERSSITEMQRSRISFHRRLVNPKPTLERFWKSPLTGPSDRLQKCFTRKELPGLLEQLSTADLVAIVEIIPVSG